MDYAGNYHAEAVRDPTVGAQADVYRTTRRSYDDGTQNNSADVGKLSDVERARFKELGSGLREIVEPEVWANAGQKERESMLFESHNYIIDQLQLPDGLSLHFNDDWTAASGDYGEYDAEARDVVVGTWLIHEAHPSEAIATMVHEAYHDYQERVIDGTLEHPYDYGKRSEWTLASENYPDISDLSNAEDFDEYANNPLEIDASAIEAPTIVGYMKGDIHV
jgi:hypothetical protein